MRSLSLFLFLVFLVTLTACAPQDEPVEFAPTIEVDATCQGLLNNSFQSTSFYVTEDGSGQPITRPLMISFLLDGRVIWNYEENLSYIGTFQCTEGVFTAQFEEGTLREIEGTFDPENGKVTIGSDVYLIVKEL